MPITLTICRSHYLASIREIKNKFGEFLDVQEYRNGEPPATIVFPDQMASNGSLPSVSVLIFHPWLISDFEMHWRRTEPRAYGICVADLFHTEEG